MFVQRPMTTRTERQRLGRRASLPIAGLAVLAVGALAGLAFAGPRAQSSAASQGPMRARTEAHARARAAATYTNPVFAQDFPDPAAIRVGRDYYAYSTSTAWEPQGHIFPILHSTDLVHWRYIGDAMAQTPAWALTDFWAPSVIASRGRYYMYYVGKGLTQNAHCIGVAVARSPAGPFADHGVVACGDAMGVGYIDPAPLIDDNGRAYLYVSVDNPRDSPHADISVLPLSADLLHQSGPRHELFTVSQAWEHGIGYTTNEGPFAVKHGRTYDLFYSGNNWQQDYAMGVAYATSPLGPFTKDVHDPILWGNAHVTGPGGGSLVQAANGGWWLVYHGWTGGPGYGTGGVRNLRLDPVTWVGNAVRVRGPSTTPQPAPNG